MAKHINKI